MLMCASSLLLNSLSFWEASKAKQTEGGEKAIKDSYAPPFYSSCSVRWLSYSHVAQNRISVVNQTWTNTDYLSAASVSTANQQAVHISLLCHCHTLSLCGFGAVWAKLSTWLMIFLFFFFPPPPLIPSLQSSIFCNLSSRLMVRILHKLITIRCAKMHLYVHLSFGFLLEACFVFCFFLLLAFKLFSIQHEKN